MSGAADVGTHFWENDKICGSRRHLLGLERKQVRPVEGSKLLRNELSAARVVARYRRAHKHTGRRR